MKSPEELIKIAEFYEQTHNTLEKLASNGSFYYKIDCFPKPEKLEIIPVEKNIGYLYLAATGLRGEAYYRDKIREDGPGLVYNKHLYHIENAIRDGYVRKHKQGISVGGDMVLKHAKTDPKEFYSILALGLYFPFAGIFSSLATGFSPIPLTVGFLAMSIGGIKMVTGRKVINPHLEAANVYRWYAEKEKKKLR